MNSKRIQSVVINLDRHEDRLAWFMEGAHRAKLPIERISAIDGTSQEHAALIQKHRPQHSSLSNGEAACVLSHRMAWKRLLDGEEEYLAIFEDDTHLSEDIAYLLKTEWMKNELHLVKLETILRKTSISGIAQHAFGGRKLHRLLAKHYGASGYIVSRRCAKRLLEITESYLLPVDVVLFDEQSPIWEEFGIFQVVPAACIQDNPLARSKNMPGRFESTLIGERSEIKAIRKDTKKARMFSAKKLHRYFSCVLRGANPFRHWSSVPVELGNPKMR